MKFLTYNHTRSQKPIKLPSPGSGPERCHVFDEQSVGAVNAALAARRPLLVRGEPGVGKTQLAEAVARQLQRAFYPFTVDSRTEARDVLWRFDAVMRLAHAQLCATLYRDQDAAAIERELAVTHFVYPGPLWWAFDAESARKASGGRPPPGPADNARRSRNGWVVLIDEIDKAESDVPNGLLEALGAGQFTPEGYEQPITMQGIAPLIVLTTNEERVLPDAFLRRCLVLHLALPQDDEGLMSHLEQRGKAHFGTQTTPEVLREAARQLVEDRRYAAQAQLSPLPGQAEYLDLLRAVIEQAPHDLARQKTLLSLVARFTLRKHPAMLRSEVSL
ncbi:MAG: AAA family ATPase [Candidatus Tectimicrobiota bacterium]